MWPRRRPTSTTVARRLYHEAVREMATAQLDQTLSDQQIEAILAFFQTLTGTYRGAPVVAASP